MDMENERFLFFSGQKESWNFVQNYVDIHGKPAPAREKWLRERVDGCFREAKFKKEAYPDKKNHTYLKECIGDQMNSAVIYRTMKT